MSQHCAPCVDDAVVGAVRYVVCVVAVVVGAVLCAVGGTALCTVCLCWWHSMACCCCWWCVCGGGCVLFVAQHCAPCVYVGGTAWRVVVVVGVCGAVCCL